MLTTDQMTTLKSWINASVDSAIATARDTGNHIALAELLNANSAFWVWKTELLVRDMHEAFVWTEMDSITQLAKWEQLKLLLSLGKIDPTKANVRSGLAEIFAGTGLAGTRAALLALAKRLASKAEAVLATGTGTSATPGFLTFQGTLSYELVGQVMAS